MTPLFFIYHCMIFSCLVYLFRCIKEIKDAIGVLRQNQSIMKEAINSLLDAMKSQRDINQEQSILFRRIFEDEPK